MLRWREFEALLGPWLKAHSVDEVLSRADALGIELPPAPSIADLLAGDAVQAVEAVEAAAPRRLSTA